MANNSRRVNPAAVVLGERLKALRIEKGLSQTDLAEMLGVAKMSVSNWESGSRMPGSIHLMLLAKTLSVPLDHFSTLKA